MGSTPVQTLGRSALLAPLMNANTDRVLVLIQLDGGNDGLNTVIPVTQDVYYTRRPSLAIPADQTIMLSDDAGLNRNLTGWDAYFGNGELAIVQGVGYPQPNQSHFRSTDIWLAGSDSSVNDRSGWTGRFLEFATPDFISDPPAHPLAVQMGGSSFIFRGRTTDMGMSIDSPERFDRLAESGTAYSLEGLPQTRAGDEMRFARTVVNSSFRYASVIQQASENSSNAVNYPDNELADNLANVARLIKGGLDTRIYLVSLGGFDTHANQAGMHRNLLMSLGTSVQAFLDDMAASGMRDRVLTMTFSEFGRTIGENGSRGTDHSSTAPLFLIGSQVNGGLFGQMPDLTQTDGNDDPIFNVDFRAVYASVLQGWFGLDPSATQSILGANYDALPLVQGGGAVSRETETIADGFALEGNYPNPFTGATTIRFTLPGAVHAKLDVFDVQGRHMQSVMERTLSGGRHEIRFDASNLPGGRYFYRLQAGERVETRSMIVL